MKTFIQELLDSKIIQSDFSDLIELDGETLEHKKINSYFYSGQNYISNSSMSDLSQEIISHTNLRNQVDYFFQTLIVKLEYENNICPVIETECSSIEKLKYIQTLFKT